MALGASLSDFKTRGFGLEDTQIHYPDRVERLILVMAVALYWAVSTGLWEATESPENTEKKSRDPPTQNRQIPDVPVQTRPQSHTTMHTHTKQAPGTMELLDY